MNRAGPGRRRPQGAGRAGFGLGLIGVFASTVLATLAALAFGPTLVPGWGGTVVASGSMRPALRTGDVVVYRPLRPSAVDVGIVIVFGDHGTSIVHRVARVNPGGSYTTKGDANPQEDTATVRPSSVAGVGTVLVPWVGLPRLWWDQRNWSRLAGAALGVTACSALSHQGRRAGSDPWRHRPSTSPAAWLTVPAPKATGSLLTPPQWARMLHRARRCR